MSRNGWCVEESAGGPDRDRPGPRPRRAKIASCPTWMVPTTICPSTIFFPTFFLLPLYAPKTAEGAQAVAQSGERRRFIFSGCPVPPYEGPLPPCGRVNPFLRQVLLARHALARVFARWSRLDALRCRVKVEFIRHRVHPCGKLPSRCRSASVRVAARLGWSDLWSSVLPCAQCGTMKGVVKPN